MGNDILDSTEAKLPSFLTFARIIPADLMRTYLGHIGAPIAQSFDWSSQRPSLAKDLAQCHQGWPKDICSRISFDVERVWSLADEAGQRALLDLFGRPSPLDDLDSGCARALFAYMHRQSTFLHAEANRLVDERRHRRLWDGFRAEPNAVVRQDECTLATVREAIKIHFETPRARVEIYDRVRPEHGGTSTALIQLNIYRENPPDEAWVLDEGEELAREVRREVVEGAITYEPDRGVIEVVGVGREDRAPLAGLFSNLLMGRPLIPQKLPPRLFDLSPLRRAHPFSTDAEDAIEAVRVTSLRLAPIDGGAERVSIDLPSRSKEDIWQIAETRFRSGNPLAGGWRVTQARVTVRFLAAHGFPASTITFAIATPNSCNLKEMTERQRTVGEKYLRRWGLRCDA